MIAVVMHHHDSPAPVTSLQLVLELNLTKPIGGSLKTRAGDPLEFSGWLGLHSTLERLCAEARREPR